MMCVCVHIDRKGNSCVLYTYYIAVHRLSRTWNLVKCPSNKKSGSGGVRYCTYIDVYSPTKTEWKSRIQWNVVYLILMHLKAHSDKLKFWKLIINYILVDIQIIFDEKHFPSAASVRPQNMIWYDFMFVCVCVVYIHICYPIIILLSIIIMLFYLFICLFVYYRN